MASHWRETAPCVPKSANGLGPELTIERIAGKQKHLIRLDQLLDAGVSPRSVSNWVARRRIFRIHRGVFATHSPPYDRRQRWLAAVFACGARAALSDLCAAHHLGLVDNSPFQPEVSVPGAGGREKDGITVHRRSIDPRDLSVRRGIPCTSPARTIIDCAGVLGADGTEDLIMAADSLRILSRRRLEELAHARRGTPGIGHVLALITDDPAEARTVNERRLRSICREFRVPLPLVNHPIRVGDRQFYADFCWPEQHLIVEADSWRWHGGRRASENDADRGQLLAVAGWNVVRFTRDQIKHERTQTGQRLLALTND